MKLAVVGSRSFSDYQLLSDCIDRLIQEKGLSIDTIVSGGAIGVDSLAADYAREHGLQIVVFLPEYTKYGKRAPIIRNRDIIFGADFVLAIWDGVSHGTKNAISLAEKAGKQTEVIHFQN